MRTINYIQGEPHRAFGRLCSLLFRLAVDGEHANIHAAGRARHGNIQLAMGKDRAGQVYANTAAESLSLALVSSHSPCESDRELITSQAKSEIGVT